MRRSQRERHVEVAFPIAVEVVGGARRSGSSENVLDPRAAQGVHRGADARGVVRAVHPLEHPVVERLRARETR